MAEEAGGRKGGNPASRRRGSLPLRLRGCPGSEQIVPFEGAPGGFSPNLERQRAARAKKGTCLGTLEKAIKSARKERFFWLLLHLLLLLLLLSARKREMAFDLQRAPAGNNLQDPDLISPNPTHPPKNLKQNCERERVDAFFASAWAQEQTGRGARRVWLATSG